MKRKAIYVLIVLVLAGFFWYSDDESTEEETTYIYVLAAASLTEALGEITKTFEEENSQYKVLCNLAGSGTLRNQIEQGADCDLFISAAKSDMDKLETQKLIDKTSRTDLLEGTLTLIASEEAEEFISETSFTEDLVSGKINSIAIGTPESVPAGAYAMQTLETLGIKDKIESKLIMGKDVRSVLDYVETGNADCGFVYKTDALLLKSGAVVVDMPEGTHEPIVYPGAIISDSKNKKAAADFLAYLKTDYGKSVFEKYGFAVL